MSKTTKSSSSQQAPRPTEASGEQVALADQNLLGNAELQRRMASSQASEAAEAPVGVTPRTRHSAPPHLLDVDVHNPGVVHSTVQALIGGMDAPHVPITFEALQAAGLGEWDYPSSLQGEVDSGIETAIRQGDWTSDWHADAIPDGLQGLNPVTAGISSYFAPPAGAREYRVKLDATYKGQSVLQSGLDLQSSSEQGASSARSHTSSASAEFSDGAASGAFERSSTSERGAEVGRSSSATVKGGAVAGLVDLTVTVQTRYGGASEGETSTAVAPDVGTATWMEIGAMDEPEDAS